MKKNTIFIFLLCCNGLLQAQSSRIELLDLVKILSPDSTAVSNVVNWPVAASKGSAVKWKNLTPQKQGANYVKTGTAAVVLNGKAVECSGVNSDAAPCKWGVSLSGTKNGYTSFTVAADNLHIESDIDMIGYFFGKNKLKATPIEKDTESVLFWMYKYKLQLAGKKEIWMKINFENQTATAAQAESSNYTDLFYIEFFTSKQAMDAR
ncbi:MAG: hypothetical protein IPP72_06035 [Chitinophagaceae bacterium]|nr:hypothetical protein [Chitinophagaceae bacterium]